MTDRQAEATSARGATAAVGSSPGTDVPASAAAAVGSPTSAAGPATPASAASVAGSSRSAAGPATPASAAATISTSQQIWSWVRYHNRGNWRNPLVIFFTIAFPMGMMVLLSIFITGDIEYGPDNRLISIPNFFVPSMAAFAAASATYSNLCVTVSIKREQGILKRVRGTPLATWKFLLSTIISSIWFAFLGATLLFIVGILFFDVTLNYSQLGWMAVYFAVGVSAFALLGMAASNLASTGQEGSAIANVTILPLAFVSDLFIPAQDPPAVIQIIGDIFPLKPFGEGMKGAFDVGPADDKLWNLLLIAAWGAAGLFFLLRYFHWVPRSERK